MTVVNKTECSTCISFKLIVRKTSSTGIILITADAISNIAVINALRSGRIICLPRNRADTAWTGSIVRVGSLWASAGIIEEDEVVIANLAIIC